MKWAALFVLLAVLIPAIAVTSSVEAASPQGNDAKAAYRMHLNDSRTVTVGERVTVWFKWRANTSGYVEVTTCTSAYDTAVWAYTGAPGAWTQVGFLICSPYNSAISFAAEKGTVYYFLVQQYGGGYPSVGATLTFSLAAVVAAGTLP